MHFLWCFALLRGVFHFVLKVVPYLGANCSVDD